MIAENEIILYQPDEAVKIEVRVEDETVWLTQQQMAMLFETTKQNISLHINNVFKEKELERNSVVKDSLTTASDGKKYHVQYYNLDVIISVGYRVKSLRGTQFRQWATKVLRDHLLRGYSINQRIERLEHRVAETENKIDFFVRTSLPPVEGIFYDGQIFDAYKFVSDLIRSAKRRIVLIDNYVDDTVLQMLDKRQDNVSACIYTKVITANFRLDIERHNQQYRPISVHEFQNSHDRFLLIDNDVYHIGASLKDLGKRWFAFCKMQLSADEILRRLENYGV